MSSLSPGTVIDESFTLLRLIGEGGMGEVWLARENALGREVALKLMLPSGSQTREERFGREARALAALNHPSILPVLRSGTDPATGRHYFATPAVLLSPSEITRVCVEVLHCPFPRGHAEPPRPPLVTAAAPRPLPLSALLDGGKTLPQAAVLRIARDLAGALAAAHAAGILHRDVKPSNVLFDASGRALLADFGLAKFVTRHSSLVTPAAQPPDSISLDESGSRKFLGSPSYAAPEQFLEGTAPSPALDWYSFGAVLYEALTGGRPRSLRKPSSFDPAHVSRRWDSFLGDLLEPDPARRLSDPAAITRSLEAIGRAIDPATRRRRRAVRAALAAAAVVATVAVVAVRFHAEPGSVSEGGSGKAQPPPVSSHAESAEATEPVLAGGGSGEAQPPPVGSHAESAEAAEPVLAGGGSGEAKSSPVAIVFPAHPMPPRLDSVWQGENRSPLQLLGTFRMLPIVRFEIEAFSGGDAELLHKVREGDGAWSSWTQNRAAIGRANNAWFEAVAMARKEASATNAPPAAHVRLALCLARLSWTYVANADQGAADAPYRDALATIDPLVESDPARYGPLRSWLLSERAYAEGMEGRFRESAADLQEAGLLWARYAPADDPGCVAQRFVLAAAFGGMLQAMGDTTNAVTMTSRAAEALDSLLFHDESERGAGDAVPRSLADLLAGCLYRLGEFHRATGTRIASVASYRRAAELWRDLFKTYGERYRTDCIQALGRLGQSLADAGRLEEAVAAWDEVRDLVAPVFASDPALYRPVVAATLDNLVRAHRALGDEERARALEAEAAALRASP